MEISISFPDITNTIQIRGFHLRVVQPGWSYQDHYHASFELLHCKKGVVTEWLNEEELLFNAGDWLLIPPGIKHRTLNKDAAPFMYLSLLFDIDDPDFRKLLRSFTDTFVTKEEISETDIPNILTKLDTLIGVDKIDVNQSETFNSLSITEKLELQAWILLTIKEILVVLQEKQHFKAREQEHRCSLYELDLAEEIEKMITESLDNPQLSVQSIAEKIGLSRSQCTKIFSKVNGISPRNYLTTKRLIKAKEMLINSDKSIQTIADETGFSSLSHFSRQFKRWTGVSPTNYRPQLSSKL